MKLGINLLLWATYIDESHLPVLERLKEIGYDGVELPIMSGEADHYRWLGGKLDELGLRRTASIAITDPKINPVSEDAAERDAARDYMKWVVDCAQASGCEVVIGPMYQTLGRFTGAGPTEEENQRVVDLLSEAAPLAEQADLTLAIEALNRFECYMCNTLATAAELARRINHPAVGIMIDTFHCHMEENDTPQAIREADDVIVHAHYSENNRGIPGTGQVDFPAVTAALRDVDYDDWVVIEAFGRAMPDLAAATCIWRDLFQSQDHCAAEGYAYLRPIVG